MSIESVYDRYAAIYDRLYGLVLADGRRQLARLLAATPGQNLLEIGVGTGLMLPLYPAHLHITGVDVSQRMLRRAERRAADLPGRNIRLLHLDGEHSRLADGAFDHVVLPYVYSVTSDPEHLMAECFRLCRPGGEIWILNHFSGLGSVWDYLGWFVKPFADVVGFRSDFSYDDYVAGKPWQVESVHEANLFALSRIVRIRKGTD